MKRSDMLDLIDGVLLEHKLPLLQGISKEILGELERAGMLPPKPQSANTDNPIFLELENYTKLLYKWEPEDETK